MDILIHSCIIPLTARIYENEASAPTTLNMHLQMIHLLHEFESRSQLPSKLSSFMGNTRRGRRQTCAKSYRIDCPGPTNSRKSSGEPKFHCEDSDFLSIWAIRCFDRSEGWMENLSDLSPLLWSKFGHFWQFVIPKRTWIWNHKWIQQFGNSSHPGDVFVAGLKMDRLPSHPQSWIMSFTMMMVSPPKSTAKKPLLPCTFFREFWTISFNWGP